MFGSLNLSFVPDKYRADANSLLEISLQHGNNRPYQLTLCMMSDRIFMSPFELTMKLLRVVPNEFSRIADHFGFNSLTWWPIGPTGGRLKDVS